jgi:hypothetical protein
MLQAVLGLPGAAQAVLSKRIVSMGARHLGRGHVHQRHRLPCWGARRGISLEAMAEVSPAGGGHGWPSAVHRSKAALMLAGVG